MPHADLTFDHHACDAEARGWELDRLLLLDEEWINTGRGRSLTEQTWLDADRQTKANESNE